MDFDVAKVALVDLLADVVIFPGSGLLPLPPASNPYPAKAKLSRLVSRRVGRPLAALTSDPPRLVAGDRQRFSFDW